MENILDFYKWNINSLSLNDQSVLVQYESESRM